MNNIIALKKLVSKLNNTEINLLRKQIENNNINSVEGKSVQLLKLLIRKEPLTSVEIQKIIYGKLNYLAFNKLCNRFKDSIHDVLLMDNSIRTSGYSKRNTLLFDLRKKVIQADIIQLRGINEDVLSIYNSIITKSALFEFYDILIQALNSKLRFVSSFGKKNVIENIKNEITQVEVNWLALNQTQRIYQSIINTISRHSEFHFYSEDLNNTILIIKDNFNRTKSSLIKYYLLNLEIEQAQILHRYSDSNILLMELQKLIKENESVYTDNRYGTVLLNISNNNLLLKQFDSAIEYAENSRKYFKGIYLTQKIVDEILFYSNFYKNELLECEKYIIFNSSFNLNESTEVLFSKFNYYKACLEFKKGNYFKCIDILNAHKEIEKDKEGWNINRRILIILSRIELGEFDSLDLSLSNMTKYLNRLAKTNFLNPRFAIILKICMVIVRENLDINRIEKKTKLILKYLEVMKKEDMKWQIKSPELINFEDWIAAKFVIKSRLN